MEEEAPVEEGEEQEELVEAISPLPASSEENEEEGMPPGATSKARAKAKPKARSPPHLPTGKLECARCFQWVWARGATACGRCRQSLCPVCLPEHYCEKQRALFSLKTTNFEDRWTRSRTSVGTRRSQQQQWRPRRGTRL